MSKDLSSISCRALLHAQSSWGFSNDVYKRMSEQTRAGYDRDFYTRIQKGLALLPDAAKASMVDGAMTPRMHKRLCNAAHEMWSMFELLLPAFEVGRCNLNVFASCVNSA